MGISPQVMRFLAAVILIAAAAMPSLAWAHEGHVHHVAAAEKATAPSHDAATPGSIAASRPTAQVAAASFATTQDVAAGPTDCASHCCGGTGMACCGAILVPDLCSDPFVQGSQSFVIPRASPLPGLPPEALPKPPKSFA
jgi:hypothetical protein